MPNTAVYQERILNALEAIQTAQEAIQATAAADPGASAFSVTYLFQAQDIGNGNITEVIAGRTGYRGHVRSIEVFNVTEAFNATTTPARVDVGITAGDLDAYAIGGSFGTTAIAAAASPAVTDGVIGTIPVSAGITITMYAPTGGTPAGIADVAVTIQYFL